MENFINTHWQRTEAPWVKLQQDLNHAIESLPKLGHYDLVDVLVGENDRPLKVLASYCLFTSHQALQEFRRSLASSDLDCGEHVKKFMIGDLIDQLKTATQPETVKVNPVYDKTANRLKAADILYAPIFDPLTKKLLMTNPEEALALLAIGPQDQKRFGIEMVYHFISDIGAPEDKESREDFLRFKIQELSFVAPRVPMRRGSATIYCVLLNLGNTMEEAAFIRSYKTFDSYADVLFVNSNLQLLTGEMEEIHYQGEHVDTIFGPIIEWQKRKQRRRMQ